MAKIDADFKSVRIQTADYCGGMSVMRQSKPRAPVVWFRNVVPGEYCVTIAISIDIGGEAFWNKM